MRYQLLVLDHDDTVVKSMEQLHYPSMLHTLAQLRPNVRMTADEYKELCADPGFEPYCRQVLGLSDEEMAFELADWQAFTAGRIPDAFEGMKETLCAFKAAGGKIGVVTHSARALVERDYAHHFGFVPDAVLDLTFTPQKPDPAPVQALLTRFALPPAAALAVDDLPPGLHMAAAAGVDFAYAAWGKPAPSVDRVMRANAPLVLETVADLQRVIL